MFPPQVWSPKEEGNELEKHLLHKREKYGSNDMVKPFGLLVRMG